MTMRLVDLPTKDRRFMAKAAKYAAEYGTLRVRIGAYTDNHFYGVNVNKTHPAIVAHSYPAHSQLHAELDLAIWSGAYMEGCTVYLVRLDRAGEWALAKPCRHCMTVLVHCNVKRVVWSVSPGEVAEVRL